MIEVLQFSCLFVSQYSNRKLYNRFFTDSNSTGEQPMSETIAWITDGSSLIYNSIVPPHFAEMRVGKQFPFNLGLALCLDLIEETGRDNLVPC